jgi:two-component system, NtrC family, nitrogen regulation response regulator NtrX
MDFPNNWRILVADDEIEIRESLKEIFIEDGYDVSLASNEKEALEIATTGIDMALIDIKLGDDNGIELLSKLKQQWPLIPVVMITGFGTVSLAKEAFKIGAHDFLEKPLRLLQVRTCVRNVIDALRLKKQIHRKEISGISELIIESPVMKTLYSQASKLSVIKEPVVIMGPSGSGKDLLARHLHYEGTRSTGPFIVTNAASLPVSLAEDELFGHEKGAFTGADRKREGCFEQAHGGTLFLDEIADMDLQIQAKLLRVLETGIFTRLGSAAPVKVDVRIVCATHKDLDQLVQSGNFRHDLWYRISAFVIKIPSLDNRKEEISPLAQHFLKKICIDLGFQRSFSPSVLENMEKISYPGNVRELKNLVARLAIYSDGPVIDVNDLDAQRERHEDFPNTKNIQQITTTNSMDFRTARLNFEIEFLKKALDNNLGNITATARDIGMAQSNLSRKLKELGIEKQT